MHLPILLLSWKGRSGKKNRHCLLQLNLSKPFPVTMQDLESSRSWQHGAEPHAYKRACPLCKQTAYRVHRRLMDRMLNLFISIWRFRCSAVGCHWEGNLRKNEVSTRASRL